MASYASGYRCRRRIQFGLFPLASSSIPGHFESRFNPHRHRDRVGNLPLRVWSGLWTWHSPGVIIALRLHRSVHLPNLHRLQTQPRGRRSGLWNLRARLPPFPADNHVILHCPNARLVLSSRSPGQCPGFHSSGVQSGHSICSDFPWLPSLRLLCVNPHHPCDQRKWCTRSEYGADPRRQQRRKPVYCILVLVLTKHPHRSLHESFDAAFRNHHGRLRSRSDRNDRRLAKWEWPAWSQRQSLEMGQPGGHDGALCN